MKVFVAIVLILFLGFGGFQLYRLLVQRASLNDRAENLAADVTRLEQENQKLSDDIRYFADARNLEKEIRKLFNYRNPGEELYIVVPKRNENPTNP
jgi:cell division protein FtsB